MHMPWLHIQLMIENSIFEAQKEKRKYTVIGYEDGKMLAYLYGELLEI